MAGMFDEVGPIVKREMVLFLVIDQSGSMIGSKVNAVNTAVREVLPEIRDIGGSDAVIRLAALLFSTGCRWMYDAPMAVEDFQWANIDAFGMTDMGAAFTELAGKLSRESFLKAPSASVAPAIFLMSDGCPTDDYQAGLARLQGNNWFRHAIKVAVAIGEDADKKMLEEFTGNPEAVITVHTPEALRKMIRFVTVTSSKIGSKSQAALNGEPQSKQLALIQDIQDFLDDNPDLNQNADDEWE